MGWPLRACRFWNLQEITSSPRDSVVLILKMGPSHWLVCQEAAGKGASPAPPAVPRPRVRGKCSGDVAAVSPLCLFLSLTGAA